MEVERKPPNRLKHRQVNDGLAARCLRTSRFIARLPLHDDVGDGVGVGDSRTTSRKSRDRTSWRK